MSDNPFERFDLDPRDGPQALTAKLRELAEDAPDERARAEIRAAWEELTLHPARRVRAALFAHPESRPPLSPRPNSPTPETDHCLTLSDLVPLPSVAVTVAAPVPDPTLESDPLLRI